MDIYSHDEIAEQKGLRKAAKIAAAAVCVIAAVICAVLLCVVKPETETRCRVFASVAAVIAGIVVIYICSFVLPYMRPKPKKRSFGGSVLHVLGNMLRQLHMYVFWGILACMLVMFLFNLVTDTTKEKKVTVFIDSDPVNETALESYLNEGLPEGIKMTKVHSFSYNAFGMNTVGADDIYIVQEADIDRFIDGFAPLYEFWPKRSVDVIWDKEGTAYGLKINDPDGSLTGMDPSGSYYIFFGKDCVHPGTDGAAAKIAERLLELLYSN